jgi:hypothetical protein
MGRQTFFYMLGGLRLLAVLGIGVLLGGGAAVFALPAFAGGKAGWDWSAPAPQAPAPQKTAPQKTAPQKTAPQKTTPQARPAEGGTASGASGDAAEAGAGAASDVAETISGIMRPNRPDALAGESELEALRRRAQTGRP